MCPRGRLRGQGRPRGLHLCYIHYTFKWSSSLDLISGRVDRASATETVDLGSIPGRVKPRTIKIGIHSFPA